VLRRESPHVLDVVAQDLCGVFGGEPFGHFVCSKSEYILHRDLERINQRMDLIQGALLAFLAFTLGLISSIIGARAGRAIDVRRDLLEELRDWADSSLELLGTRAIMSYEKTHGMFTEEEIIESRALSKWRVITKARWVGMTRASKIGSAKLISAVEALLREIDKFEDELIGYQETGSTDFISEDEFGNHPLK